MYIQTEQTPNENALKFLVPQLAYAGETLDFTPENAASGGVLVRKIFEVGGVERVFLTSEFLTVTKAESEAWLVLKPQILEVIFEYKMNEPETSAAKAGGSAANDYDYEALTPLEKEIVNLLEERVAPAVAMDGGSISFVSFDAENGIVYLKMKGACSGCPSSSVTLQSGIKRMLQHYIPEVIEVAAV